MDQMRGQMRPTGGGGYFAQPAPVPFGGGGGGVWACYRCTFQNAGTATICGACGSPRILPQAQPQFQAPPPTYQQSQRSPPGGPSGFSPPPTSGVIAAPASAPTVVPVAVAVAVPVVGGPPPRLEIVAEKLGSFFGGWRQRRFVLDRGSITYYTVTGGAGVEKGCVRDIRQCQPPAGITFGLIIMGQNKNLTMRFANAGDASTWQQAVMAHITFFK